MSSEGGSHRRGGRQVQVSLPSYARCPLRGQEENNPGRGRGRDGRTSTAGLPVAMERRLGSPSALAGLQWDYYETVSHRDRWNSRSTRGFIGRGLEIEIHQNNNNYDP